MNSNARVSRGGDDSEILLGNWNSTIGAKSSPLRDEMGTFPLHHPPIAGNPPGTATDAVSVGCPTGTACADVSESESVSATASGVTGVEVSVRSLDGESHRESSGGTTRGSTIGTTQAATPRANSSHLHSAAVGGEVKNASIVKRQVSAQRQTTSCWHK